MNTLTVALLLSLSTAHTEQWPGFLGTGDSTTTAKAVPVEWSPTANIAWKQTIPGYGQSSPVIWGDHAFVTSVEGAMKEKLHVVCLSLKTGKVVWDHTHASTHEEKSSVYISRAAPTPVVDENGIYAYFESGDVMALSHAGQEQWTRSLTKDYGAPVNKFGLSASPVQTDDRIMILIDDEGPSYVVAISKETGDVLWKTDRTSRVSWSSPALIPIGDTVQLVCSSAGSVDGYDVDTGKQLWTFTEVGGNNNTSPVAAGNGTFFVGASPGRDGKNTELARKSNGLLQVSKTEAGWTPSFAWTNTAPTPSWGSPMSHQGYAYWVNRAGVLYCLDVKTGESVYTERLKQGCWATPVAIGDHIYIFGKSGLTTVLAAGNKFKVVAENELWTEENPPINNTPTAEEETEERKRGVAMFSRPTLYGTAIVNNYILIRTGSQLYCIHASE